jgi:hypothetical protein
MAEQHPDGVHRYRSVTEGEAVANECLSSRLSMSESARQKVSPKDCEELGCAGGVNGEQWAGVANRGGFLGSRHVFAPVCPSPRHRHSHRSSGC